MGHMVTAQVVKNHLQAIGKSNILEEFEKLVKAFLEYNRREIKLIYLSSSMGRRYQTV
jgi:hypothetical protein